MAPEEAVAHLAQAVTARGAHVTTQSSTTITGVVNVSRTPNILVALLLFLLCVVPLVIYLIVASRGDTYVWSVFFAPDDTGSTVTFTAQGQAGPIIFQAISTLPGVAS